MEPIPYWILIVNPAAWLIALGASMYRLSRLEGWRWHWCMAAVLIGQFATTVDVIAGLAASHAHRPAPHLGLWFELAALLLRIIGVVGLVHFAPIARSRRKQSEMEWTASGGALREMMALTAWVCSMPMGINPSRSSDLDEMVYLAFGMAVLIVLMALMPQPKPRSASKARKAARR